MYYNTGSLGILVPTEVYVSGTWKVEGETLVATITQSTFANDKLVGAISSDKLISVTDNIYTVITEKGDTKTYTRKY
jgi:hypothetical protein